METRVVLIAVTSLLVGLLGALLLFGMGSSGVETGDFASETEQSTSSTTTTSTSSGNVATMQNQGCVFDADTATQINNPIACVETTMGTFEFVLYLDKAPITAQNFIDLADEGFYEGLIFHRIIDGFVIQGGDPLGTGEGGPDHTIPLEIHPELRHDTAGIVAMARAQDPDSAGNQYYVTLSEIGRLDDNYAVFGRVIEGLDVVLEIGHVETDENDRPIEDVVMTRVTIFHPEVEEEE